MLIEIRCASVNADQFTMYQNKTAADLKVCSTFDYFLLLNGCSHHPKPAAGTPGEFGGAAPVLERELRSAILSFDKKHVEAVALAREAAASEEAMPFEFGPPMISKPTFELLGEVLLAARKPGEAQAAFQKSLARTPGRSRSLIGLARAASAAGDRATAESAVQKLKSNWHAGDKNLPELAEISRLVASAKE